MYTLTHTHTHTHTHAHTHTVGQHIHTLPSTVLFNEAYIVKLQTRSIHDFRYGPFETCQRTVVPLHGLCADE